MSGSTDLLCALKDSKVESTGNDGDVIVLYMHADDICWEAALVLCEGGSYANKTGLIALPFIRCILV